MEEVQVAVEAMQGDILTLGPYLKRFQKEFANYLGCQYAFGVSSCTGAWKSRRRFWRSKKVTRSSSRGSLLSPPPSHSFVSEPKLYSPTWTLIPILVNAETIAAKIIDRTKAIYVVHMYGMPADMDAIIDLARQNGLLKVVEDCAHGAGAEYKDRKAGTFGDIGCFSFHTVKNVATLGKDGLLVTNNKE